MSVRRFTRPVETAELSIGPRLRAARQTLGLTLEQVAGATGLTKGFLSRLERDEVSPSVASLVGVCEVLGVRVGELFESPATSLVRAGEGPAINFGGTGVVEHLLTPGSESRLQVIHSVVAGGGTGGDELYALHADVEFVYVVRGQLELVMTHETVRLGPGDAFTFPGTEPHTWRNVSRTRECEVLWALAPAP